MTLGSARLSFGSELSNSRICNSPFTPRMGKDVLPGFCSGRSATRKSSQVRSLNLKTPGFSRHSTFIRSMLGRMSLGLSMGFSAKRFAMSAILSYFLIAVTHDDLVDDGPFSLVQYFPAHGSENHDPRSVGRESDARAVMDVLLEKLITDGVVNISRLGPQLDHDRLR